MKNRLPIENENGITIKQLIDYLSNFPDDGEIWIGTAKGLSNQVHQLCELGDGSIILCSNSIEK